MPYRDDDWERRRWRRDRDMEGRFNRERDFERGDWTNYERGFEGPRSRHERPENPYDHERNRRFGRREEEGWRSGQRWDEGNWGPGRTTGREDWESYGRPEDLGGETGFRGGYRRDWDDQERDWDRGRRMDWERNRQQLDRSRDWDRPGSEDWERDRQTRDRDWDRQREMRERNLGRQREMRGRDWDRGYYWNEGEQDFGRGRRGGYEDMMGRERGRFEGRQGGYGFEDEEDIYDYEEPYDWSYTEVWTIEGPYTGIGPQGYQRSDDRIFEEVCERLSQHGQIDASDIEVDVENGEVFLKGKVDNRHSKRMAEDVAATVPGVMDVNNQLKVHDQSRHEHTGRHRQMGSSMGGEMRNKIRDRMKVLGRDKQEIGEVKEIRDNDFLVDRPLARDVYVPFNACSEITRDRIVLNVKADEVNDQDWPVPEIIDTDFGNE
jgi:hypothetical protein